LHGECRPWWWGRHHLLLLLLVTLVSTKAALGCWLPAKSSSSSSSSSSSLLPDILVSKVHILPTVIPTTCWHSRHLQPLLLLLAPCRRCACHPHHCIIRCEVHFLPTVPLLTPALLPLLLLLLLAVLLQEVSQVCVVGTPCCSNELLCCPACLLKSPESKEGCRGAAMHLLGTPTILCLLLLLLLLLLGLHALEGRVLLQLRLQLHVGCACLHWPLLKLLLHVPHLLLLLLVCAVLQHLRLLVLREEPALLAERLLLLLPLLLHPEGCADIACTHRQQVGRWAHRWCDNSAPSMLSVSMFAMAHQHEN
jgi:hypothetical protein